MQHSENVSASLLWNIFLCYKIYIDYLDIYYLLVCILVFKLLLLLFNVKKQPDDKTGKKTGIHSHESSAFVEHISAWGLQ